MRRAVEDRVTRLTFAIACLLVPVWGGATTLKDVRVGIHVLDFVAKAPPARAGIGIIYDPHVKESLEDAERIRDALSSPPTHLAAELKPALIEISELEESLSLRAVIVADRMKPHYDMLAEFGRRTHTLVISSDLDCARAGKCTVGIASSPRVEVIISSQQAKASGIQFSEAFLMMVTEY